MDSSNTKWYPELPQPWTVARKQMEMGFDQFFGFNTRTGERTKLCLTYDEALQEARKVASK